MMKYFRKCLLIGFPLIGWLAILFNLSLLTIMGCSNQQPEQASNFSQARKAKQTKVTPLSKDQKKPTIDKFCKFLKGIHSEELIESEISQIYSPDAYLNDTLKTLNGREAIKQHFLKTSKAMTDYEVEIQDIAQSEQGYYIRWEMNYSSPKLNKGKNIKSIGITYAEFNADGLVILHQDFWDSTEGFFGHVPVVGSGIRVIKNRL